MATNTLNMLAEKVVQPAIVSKHLAYCPTMDLIAFVTLDDQVHVHRLNGQRVFGVSGKHSMGRINNIRWKPNGQIIAVAFQNSVLQLTNAHTGKVIHQINCASHSGSQICCLGWSINSTGIQEFDWPSGGSGPDVSLDDLLGRGRHTTVPDEPPDLPSDLAFLDVETVLPKLSSLALGGGAEDDVFNSRRSLDTIFQAPSKSASESADVLVVGFEDGTVHLSIYDFFDIGSFNLRMASQSFANHLLLGHCAHPFSTTHALLIAGRPFPPADLFLVPLDLRLISNTGRYLSLLASKSTQLHNILRYMQQVQGQIYAEFKSSQDLPRRFMQNIEEPLQKDLDCTWIQAAYHLVVTGNCYPQVKEWMVDELGDRGHKRWDKAVTTGYETVQRLAHENLLPALERFTVLVSRLRGLSKFQDSRAALGLSTKELDNILDTNSCLQLLTHHILIAAGSELRSFSAFSAWLKYEIEIQSIEPGSSAAQEASERDNNIDHASTLKYIQGAMKQSRLSTLFNMCTIAEGRQTWDLTTEGRSLYELYKRELKMITQLNASEKNLPGLDALIGHLDAQCNAVFGRIAETQRRNIRFGNPVNLGRNAPARMDMRMLAEEGKYLYAVYIAVVPHSQDTTVKLFKVTLKVENGMSSTESVTCATIYPLPGIIRDISFVDDENMMLAIIGESSSYLMNIQYRQSDGKGDLIYVDFPKGDEETSTSINSFDLEQSTHLLRHSFPKGPAWTPERIEINGRKGRRAMCVLAEDALHYRIYDLDSMPNEEETMEIVND